MSKPKELKLYKCWECNGSYYASEMTTTDKKKEVGDFCKECWKDIKELADPFLDEYLQEIQEKKNKKEYTVSFIPFDTLQYDYVVEAKDEDEAYEKGKEELRWAIGYDASKDWECSAVEEKK